MKIAKNLFCAQFFFHCFYLRFPSSLQTGCIVYILALHDLHRGDVFICEVVEVEGGVKTLLSDAVCVCARVCSCGGGGGKMNTVSESLFLRRFAHPCGFVVVELYLGLQNVITLPAGIREKEWIRKRKNVKVKL